jgi:hypothetical protein
MVSAAIGAVVVVIALAAPRNYAFISPMMFALMWPAHAIYGSRREKKRKAFEAQLPSEPATALK